MNIISRENGNTDGMAGNDRKLQNWGDYQRKRLYGTTTCRESSQDRKTSY